jgi:hypothetical protein
MPVQSGFESPLPLDRRGSFDFTHRLVRLGVGFLFAAPARLLEALVHLWVQLKLGVESLLGALGTEIVASQLGVYSCIAGTHPPLRAWIHTCIHLFV